MRLVALHGKAGSGKDTFARALQQHRPYMRMAFADPLKAAVAGLFNIPQAQAFSDNKDQVLPHWNLTLRDVLQRFGTEAMRGNFGTDFWVERWLAEFNALPPEQLVVITDLRFPNEATRVREMGGRVIHIKRPGAGLGGTAGTHASEQVLPFEFHLGDRIVENTGSLDDLARKASILIHDLEAAQ